MERSDELKAVFLRLYEAFRAYDLATVGALLAQQDGLVFLGTDPRERWVGHAAVLESFRAPVEGVGADEKVLIVAGDPQAYVEGTVGWVEDQSRLEFADGRAPIPTRVTMVFHQE